MTSRRHRAPGTLRISRGLQPGEERGYLVLPKGQSPETGGVSLPGQAKAPVPGGQASLEMSQAVSEFMTSSWVAPQGDPWPERVPSGSCNTYLTHQYLPRWVPDLLCSLRPVAAPLWAWFLTKGCQTQPQPSPAWCWLCHCLWLAQLQTAGQGCHMLSHVTGSGWGLHPTQRTGASAAPSPCPSWLKPPGRPEQV